MLAARLTQLGAAAARRAPPQVRLWLAEGRLTELRCKENTSNLSRISRELSCLSSGLPSAFLRSLFNSSTARIYSACSSPAGCEAVTNFDSGFTRSTSDDFFNGTEINVAISARKNDKLNRKKLEADGLSNKNNSKRITS